MLASRECRNKLLAALKICSRSKDLNQGKILHSRVIEAGFGSDTIVATSLIDMYAKCSSMAAARDVFDSIPSKDTVLWNAIVLGYASSGDEELALKLFATMNLEGFAPNRGSFIAAIKACINLAAREEDQQSHGEDRLKLRALGIGKRIHSQAAMANLDSDSFLKNSLVDMYAKCGSLAMARRVFDATIDCDVVTYTALMLGYADNGDGAAALELFATMQRRGCIPSARSFVAALKACSTIVSSSQFRGAKIEFSSIRPEAARRIEPARSLMLHVLETGMGIHLQAARASADSDVFVANSLIGMYSSCGSLIDARRVFDKMPEHSPVSWNVLVLACAENNEPDLAVELALDRLDQDQDQDAGGSGPIFLPALRACIAMAAREDGSGVDGKIVKLGTLEKGMQLHSRALSSGDLTNKVASFLVDVYSKCGSMVDSWRAFELIDCCDVVSITSLMLAFYENGDSATAIEIFWEMIATSSWIVPDHHSFVAALKAAAAAAELSAARAIHGHMCRTGAVAEEIPVAALVDSYGKCGALAAADRVFFDGFGSKSVVAWTAIITAHSRESRRALELFRYMIDDGVAPNAVTMQSVLAACSHGGLVEEGKMFFAAMEERYGVEPEMQHYVCMVDLLGRANELEGAVRLLQQMPYRANAVAWRTILSSCRRWENYGIARAAFQELMKMDGLNAAGYDLLIASA